LRIVSATSDQPSKTDDPGRRRRSRADNWQNFPGAILILGRRRQGSAQRCAHWPSVRRRTGRVVGVARFSEAGLLDKLEGWGIECIEADLLDRVQIEALPKLPNVVFMAGRKFRLLRAPRI
jgi:hypothetical protein